MKNFCVIGMLVSLLGLSSVDVRAEPPSKAETFVDGLMAQMTLEEKIGQLRLVSVGPEHPVEQLMAEIREGKAGGVFNTVVRPDIRRLQDEAMKSRLKIPLFFAYDVTHGHRTVFPISLGMASSFDMDAIALSGRISAEEAAADGLNMTFSPMLDVSRDPRWGRVSEGFGEDTYLASRIAGVLIRAYQGDDVSAPDSLFAVFKHFAGYGATEGGRDYNTVDMSPQRLYQDYLPPYKAAIDAGAGGAMVSLSTLNGVPSTVNRWLLHDLLREQWGYDGLVMSDHGAVYGLTQHGVAATDAEAAQKALHAGIDMDMNDDFFQNHLPALVAEGKVDPAEIDAACRRVLLAKYRMGLFEDAYHRVGKAADDPVDVNAESRLHRAEARDVARKSMVLLENRKKTLPLKKQGTVAVIGPMADSPRDVIGSWSAAGRPYQAISVYAGLRDVMGERGKVLYAKGSNVSGDANVLGYLNAYGSEHPVDSRPEAELLDEARSVAEQADVVVAVVGEAQGMAHESASRANLDMPGTQRRLLEMLKKTGKPLVIVLMNGRPLVLNWEQQHADAMLETWFSGTEGGHAIADVLFGDYNPAGKLPMSFPRSVGQIPVNYNHLNTGRPHHEADYGKYTSQYFDEPYGPLYPFGYGLSYTEFSLSPVTLSSTRLEGTGELTASVTVSNTGSVAGETVVQLYLRDPAASISRPLKELKDFQKVRLEACEQQVVRFSIQRDELAFVNADLQTVVEPGEFRVMIGLDSANLREASFVYQ